MKPDLLGYALNALEPDEHRSVEAFLAGSIEAREELAAIHAALTPLSVDAELEPSANLVADTLKRVAAYRCRRVPQSEPSPVPPVRRRRPVGFSYRQLNALVAAGIIFVLCMLIPPALLHARHRQGVMACADNLHQFHTQLTQYSQDNNGDFPRFEKSGPLSAAVVYPVKLSEAGCWTESMRTNCPGSRAKASSSRPPTPQQFGVACATADPESMRQLCETLGGCYGYHLGYENNGTFTGIRRNQEDQHVPIMADRPLRERENPQWRTLNSPNHSGLGQNVLYLGGHVKFVRGRFIGADDIYLNGGGRLAVGQGPRDAVLGPGEARPYPDQD